MCFRLFCQHIQKLIFRGWGKADVAVFVKQGLHKNSKFALHVSWFSGSNRSKDMALMGCPNKRYGCSIELEEMETSVQSSNSVLGRTAGPSYSHATAINYCYKHIVSRRRPAYFGITDHDLFLLKPVDLSPILDAQQVYGPLRARDEFWYLSAILNFYNYRYLRTQSGLYASHVQRHIS